MRNNLMSIHYRGSLIMIFLLTLNMASAQEERLTQGVSKYREVLTFLDQNYLDSIDADKLTETAIKAILRDLDPHSSYISRKDVRKTNEPLEGGFNGVGLSFQVYKDTVYVMSVVPDGPGSNAGIRGGDRILRIDSVDVSGVKMDESRISPLLRGKKGSKVTLRIRQYPENTISDIRVERDRIPIHSVDAAFIVGRSTGYVKLSRFSANTFSEFRKSLKELKGQGMTGLILDLRGNSGGYLYAAIELADEFLEKDKLIVYTRGLHSEEVKYHSKSGGDYEDGPLLLMVDESTASASEILSGAIQDWDRGIIAGRRTYGKGLVQKPYYLADGSMVRITNARYYTPSGRCIQKPYDRGTDKYFEAISERSKKGEFIAPDSLKVPDSLVFTAPSGKKVYGGGGIMPAYFIPSDSSSHTAIYREISRKGLISEFSLTWLKEHRAEIEDMYKDGKDFAEHFVIDDGDFAAFINLISAKGITWKDEELKASWNLLNTQLKATIGRNVYRSDVYYRVMAGIDPGLRRAIELIGAADREIH